MRMPETLGLSLALLVASPAAMAKQNPSAHHHTGAELQAEIGAAAAGAEREENRRREAGQRQTRENVVARARAAAASGDAASLPAPDQYIGPLQRRRAAPGRTGRLVWQPACRPAHRQRRAARYRPRDRRASLAAAEFAGAGHQSAQRPLGDRTDQRSRPGQPLAADRYVAERRGGDRHDRSGDRPGHDRAGGVRRRRRRLVARADRGAAIGHDAPGGRSRAAASRRNRRFHRLSPFCNCGRKGTAGAKSRHTAAG